LGSELLPGWPAVSGGGVQLDEVAFPVILAAKLAERSTLVEMSSAITMIRPRDPLWSSTTDPITTQDRWEGKTRASAPLPWESKIAALLRRGGTFFDDPGTSGPFASRLPITGTSGIEDWTLHRTRTAGTAARRPRLLRPYRTLRLSNAGCAGRVGPSQSIRRGGI